MPANLMQERDSGAQYEELRLSSQKLLESAKCASIMSFSAKNEEILCSTQNRLVLDFWLRSVRATNAKGEKTCGTSTVK
jgi:hypothetical protein